MVKTYGHFDHVVVGSNTPGMVMKTCEVLDLTKTGKVGHSLSISIAVLEVQFGKSWSFK